MRAVKEKANTAGRNPGQSASQNPVACDSGQILYNLNLGSYEFSVQTTDSAVSNLLTSCKLRLDCMKIIQVSNEQSLKLWQCVQIS